MNRQLVNKAKNSKNSTLPTTDMLRRNPIDQMGLGLPVDMCRPLEKQIGKSSLPRTESHFNHDFSRIPARVNSPYPMQAKLKIGQPNDRYEQEADRVAEQVTQLPDLRLERACAFGGGYPQGRKAYGIHESASFLYAGAAFPILQTMPYSHGSEKQKTPPLTSSLANFVNSPGQGEPLGVTMRQRIEPVLNADLSAVRIHRNLIAQQAAEQLGAKAFTHGRDIFFGPKHSPGDIHLLAHEATHAVQQSGQGGVASQIIQRDGASYHEGVVRIVWSDDYAEVYRRIVAAVDASRDFSGIPRASMWQSFHTPATQFHRRHSARHLSDLNEGDRVEIHVSGFYDAEDVPGMSQVHIWHNEDIPAPTPAPTPAPAPEPAPSPPPDLASQGKIRWNPQTPERVDIIEAGVTPRLIAADLYGDESLATHIYAVWNELERGGPFTVNTELPTNMFVRIEYGRLRSSWRSQYDQSTLIISRDVWGARAPIVDDASLSYEPYTGDLEQIYNSIAIHHAGNEGYRTIAEVQNLHMDDRNMADIGYHYGVDRWGNVSEGRDIGVKGAHIEGGNTAKIGIVLLADLDEQIWDSDDEVNDAMEAALLQLIHYLIGRFPLIQFLGGHKEYNTDRTCPGNLGMARMNRWRSHTGLSAPPAVR